MLGQQPVTEGSRLGKYLIRRQLGRGGMGVVYLAEDSLLAREVAVKVLLPSLGADQDFAARFRDEARVVARLLHPNIVHINSFDWIEDRFVIDMEFVDGLSLDRFMARHILTPATVLSIARQALCGLAACHEHGVVHRDIKPTNILITAQERVKLGDFGIAKAFASHMEDAITRGMSSGFILGTPHYAAPELWDGTSPTPAWDVYSLGVWMYQALAGVLPYEGASPFAIMKQVQSGAIVPLRERAPSVSGELASYVHTLLSLNPSERPPDAAAALELMGAIPELPERDLLLSQTTLVRPISSRLYARSGWRTAARRWGPAMAAIALVVLASVGAYSLFGVELRLADRAHEAPQPVSTPAAQDSAAMRRLLTKDELLASVKRAAGPDYLFFDTAVLGSEIRYNLHWMMERPQGGRDSTIVAVTDHSLWRLRMASASPEHLAFEGDWAEYEDNSGTTLRQGTVSGTGAWTAVGEAMAASLAFVCATDRTTVQRTLVISRHKEPVTDTAFLYALEEAPLIQPLLYHELMERQLPWAAGVEALLPSVEGARFTVPFVEAASEDLRIDGQFDEPLWAQTGSRTGKPVGRCAGVPLWRGAMLTAVCTREGLLLGFALPRSAGTPTWLEVAWLADLSIPVQASNYERVRLPVNGPTDAHRFAQDQEVPWTCDWRLAEAETATGWQWELFVPFAASWEPIGAEAAVPWRLNGEIVDERQQGEAKILARWGFPELAEAVHGMKPVVVRARETGVPAS